MTDQTIHAATPIVTLLSRIAAEVGAVRKAERNTQQNFNFRGIDAVVNAVAPALRKHGVIVVPHLDSIESQTVEVGKNRTLMGHVAVVVTFRFLSAEGGEIACTVPGEAMDSGDKATAKAMSVAFRTALLQALTLPTDEPDPDGESFDRSPPQAKKKSPDAETNKLKARALELAGGDPDEAREVWAATLIGLELDPAQPVPADRVDAVGAALDELTS